MTHYSQNTPMWLYVSPAVVMFLTRKGFYVLKWRRKNVVMKHYSDYCLKFTLWRCTYELICIGFSAFLWYHVDIFYSIWFCTHCVAVKCHCIDSLGNSYSRIRLNQCSCPSRTRLIDKPCGIIKPLPWPDQMQAYSLAEDLWTTLKIDIIWHIYRLTKAVKKLFISF